MARPLRFATVLATVLAAAGGCGSERPPPHGPAAERAKDCGKVPRTLQGSYYMRTQRADLPPELVDGPVGVNLLLLGPEHHGFLRVAQRAERVWPMCVDGRVVSFPDTPDGGCAGRGTGTYRWRLTGNSLALERIEDGCLSRVHALTVHPYRRFNASGWNCHSTPDCAHKLDQIELLERTGSCEAAGCSETP